MMMMSTNTPSKIHSTKFNVVAKLINNKLKDITSVNKLDLFQNDPHNPLYCRVKSFGELNLPTWLLNGVYAMDFKKPSRIQEAVLPLLCCDSPKNMIAQSQSGTGKTASFLLAALLQVNVAEQVPQVIVLVPTYELALQIGKVATDMAKFSEITVKKAVRGERIERNVKITEHVIIGTPGKLIDFAFKFHAFDMSKIKVFVLDEADIMIDVNGMRTQSLQLRSKLSPDCLLLLFSATFSQNVHTFAQEIVSQPYYLLALAEEEQSLDNIKQYYMEVENETEKFDALQAIYDTVIVGQTFIFVETRVSARRLAERLRQDGHSVGLLSGELSVEERNEVITRFRNGQERVIIATNVMARGIDIPQVTLVVNYDLPLTMDKQIDYETYLHRIGRCGRFGKEGIAINFAESQETLDKIKKIEQHFFKPIQKIDYLNFEAIEAIGFHL